MARTIALTLALLLLGGVSAAARGRESRPAHASAAHARRAHQTGLPPLRAVNEYGSLALHGRGSSSTIDERGYGWGSFHCAVSIELTLRGTLVSAQYRAYPHGGQIAGAAKARIHSATSGYASFSGTIWLHGGSGSYSRASGRAGFYGTIDRHTYAMRVHIAGRVRL